MLWKQRRRGAGSTGIEFYSCIFAEQECRASRLTGPAHAPRLPHTSVRRRPTRRVRPVKTIMQHVCSALPRVGRGADSAKLRSNFVRKPRRHRAPLAAERQTPRCGGSPPNLCGKHLTRRGGAGRAHSPPWRWRHAAAPIRGPFTDAAMQRGCTLFNCKRTVPHYGHIAAAAARTGKKRAKSGPLQRPHRKHYLAMQTRRVNSVPRWTSLIARRSIGSNQVIRSYAKRFCKQQKTLIGISGGRGQRTNVGPRGGTQSSSTVAALRRSCSRAARQ